MVIEAKVALSMSESLVLPVPSLTNVSPQALAGGKEAGSALWIDGVEAVPFDHAAEWAASVTLQPGEKSFTDEELKAISERIVAAAGKAGARLRD